jgi:hypothetical protein
VLVPALAVLLRLVFEPLSLRAQGTPEHPPHASLVFEAGDLADRCVSKAELEQAVQAQLGRVVFVEAEATPTVIVRVRLEESAPGRFRAVIASGPASGAPDAASDARELEASADCRALDEQLALVVALLVDAEPAPPPPAPEPPPPPPPPEPPPPPVQDTSPVSSAPNWESAPAGPWHLAVDGSGVVAFGLVPHVGAGASVGVLVTPPGWPGFRVRATGYLPARARAAPGSWLGVTLVAAGGGVCPELGAAGRFSLRICLGVEATYLRVQSHGLDGGTTSERFGAQGSAALLGALSLGAGFRVGLELGTSFPFRTARFTVDRDGRRDELYRTPFAPALVALGISYEFY